MLGISSQTEKPLACRKLYSIFLSNGKSTAVKPEDEVTQTNKELK
jgi:hypothetical protein